MTALISAGILWGGSQQIIHADTTENVDNVGGGVVASTVSNLSDTEVTLSPASAQSDIAESPENQLSKS
ncbi:hypothetical protein, partial [Limosilactobacillus caviae]|uniref:hypothetical protein n=1 Tax=Limosilactobacillus caviae TaxID=1769424 RepID=UPI001E469839